MRPRLPIACGQLDANVIDAHLRYGRPPVAAE